MSVFELAKDAWARGSADNISLLAAGVAFYAFLAFVPLLAAVVLTYGLFADPEDAVRQAETVAGVLPRAATELVIEQMQDVAGSDPRGNALGLVVAIGTAIFGALRGAKSVIIALNIAEHVDQPRGFIGQTGMALSITLSLILVIAIGLVAIGATSSIPKLIPGFPEDLLPVVRTALWILFAVAAIFAHAFIYRYAPNRDVCSLKDVLPGAVVATILLLAVTFGFAAYVSSFGSYNATYGALGAVVILLFWLYLSTMALLLGAELNEAVRCADGAAARRSEAC
ncbi:YihY/virulence factor BrkB family protein [Sphingomicrobium sediminis]|uniref:YihY/virulence factor BrkB family protein n=1 Tax=Sphingomicrobium sediminis TaxID=2950949 RepID=A0A9X2J2V4_9SPHN|nr:YihY/virulence factor BrkB family protein [Sphingomicrobium sediminis]MCM8557425.1 YihY/virulence factor BrkB family protein [Sphingomicrobium sediminis]